MFAPLVIFFDFTTVFMWIDWVMGGVTVLQYLEIRCQRENQGYICLFGINITEKKYTAATTKKNAKKWQ